MADNVLNCKKHPIFEHGGGVNVADGVAALGTERGTLSFAEGAPEIKHVYILLHDFFVEGGHIFISVVHGPVELILEVLFLIFLFSS